MRLCLKSLHRWIIAEKIFFIKCEWLTLLFNSSSAKAFKSCHPYFRLHILVLIDTLLLFFTIATAYLLLINLSLSLSLDYFYFLLDSLITFAFILKLMSLKNSLRRQVINFLKWVNALWFKGMKQIIIIGSMLLTI